MICRPPSLTVLYTLVPDPTLFRSCSVMWNSRSNATRPANRSSIWWIGRRATDGHCGTSARGVRSLLRDRAEGREQERYHEHPTRPERPARSEEHTSELQSLQRNTHAGFLLQTKQNKKPQKR